MRQAAFVVLFVQRTSAHVQIEPYPVFGLAVMQEDVAQAIVQTAKDQVRIRLEIAYLMRPDRIETAGNVMFCEMNRGAAAGNKEYGQRN